MPSERVQFVQGLVDKCLVFLEELCGVQLYSYQKEMADRLFFSLIYGDSEEISVETARQIGKSETVACVAATAMVILPKLAKFFPNDPILKKFKNGVMIGLFGPTDLQAETVFSRIEDRLNSESAQILLADAQVDDELIQSGKMLKMRSGSFARMQTAHPKAKIESKTYHLIIIDEAQDADSETVRRRIHPMMAAVGGTIAKIGTPAAHKSDYYEATLRNKRRGTTHGKKNHFSYDWHRAAKENPYYASYMKKEIARLGEDSDEFQMSYNLKWLLERGMFITDEQLDFLGDKRMPIVTSYTDSPIVIGVDVARSHDSTVCTAVWVDWEHPDEFGLYNHRVLNWLEIHGEAWESQYAQICEFASYYYVMRMGVDTQGMGGPVAEQLQILLPNIEVVPVPSNPLDQSERWKHLMQLMGKGMIGWPAHPSAKRTLKWKRFQLQMVDVEKEYRGRYIQVAAPKNEKNAHDDYVDSLAIACSLTQDFGQELEVEVWSQNPFLERGIRAS